MKIIYTIGVAALLLTVACKKNIDQLNQESKRAAAVPAGTLFNNGVKTLSDGMASANVNVNIFRHVIKHWAQATNQEEAQYDFNTRAINAAWWTRMYRDIINDLRDAKRIVK